MPPVFLYFLSNFLDLLCPPYLLQPSSTESRRRLETVGRVEKVEKVGEEVGKRGRKFGTVLGTIRNTSDKKRKDKVSVELSNSFCYWFTTFYYLITTCLLKSTKLHTPNKTPRHTVSYVFPGFPGPPGGFPGPLRSVLRRFREFLEPPEGP